MIIDDQDTALHLRHWGTSLKCNLTEERAWILLLFGASRQRRLMSRLRLGLSSTQWLVERFPLTTIDQCSVLSVPPLCYPRLRGEFYSANTQHRDTENTEDAQRFSNQVNVPG